MRFACRSLPYIVLDYLYSVSIPTKGTTTVVLSNAKKLAGQVAGQLDNSRLNDQIPTKCPKFKSINKFGKLNKNINK